MLQVHWLKQTPASYLSDEQVLHVGLINNVPLRAAGDNNWFISPERHLFNRQHHLNHPDVTQGSDQDFVLTDRAQRQAPPLF